MVTSGARFLIDATFIAEKSRKAFLGAPLLTVGGQDCTFVFGFLRDVLRLRRIFGINAGLVLVGRESYSVSSRDNIHSVIASFKELGIPHIHDPLNLTLNLACSICSHFSHIITADEKFLQLTGESLVVVLPRKSKEREWDWMSSKRVKDMIGIAPHHVPTYMALTDSSNTAALTNRQAVRLIESFGDLDGLYVNLGHIMPAHARTRLAKSEAQIRSICAGKTCRHVEGLALKSFSKCPLNKLDTAANRGRLTKYGFRSLSILLPTPAQLQCDLPDNVCSPISYHAVVDRKGLQQLKALVCASKLCAVDVESDGKDPRTANLLGIAFSVKIGEAHFVPLAADHLKGVTRTFALRIIKQMLISGVSFVGHNIKYDHLLLRKAGAKIRNIHFDTMLAAFECHGDWPFFNLAYVCKRILGKEIKSYSDIVSDDSSFLDLPLIEMVNHACQDADFALRLYPALSDQLEERCIARQFREHTMKHLERLSNLEFNGMAIDLERVGRIQKRILTRAEHLRLSICTTVGRVVDLGSHEELAAVLRKIPQLQGYVGSRRVTVSTLEHLAVSDPLARQILNFRRLRNQVGRLEAISASVRNGRLYALFNQISSRTGLTTSRPNLLPELKSSFERGVQDLFADPAQSLRTLGEITKDPNLQRARIKKYNGRAHTMEAPSCCALDQDDLLLRLAIGQSDAELGRGFTIERLKMASIRNHLEKKYKRMFQWLTKFRCMALDHGYAANGVARKYIDGLKSADVARKRLAVEHAIRWLIRY
jgi:hypothetical protein